MKSVIIYHHINFDINLISDKGDVCIVERLFSSSLVAVVSLSAPRKLKVCHFKVIHVPSINYKQFTAIRHLNANRKKFGYMVFFGNYL